MTRPFPTRPGALYVLVTAAVALLGCDGGRTVSGAAPPRGLTVRVRVAAELAPAAQALGWSAAAVPGAIVVAEYASADTGQPSVNTATTDASGVSRFSDLRAGRYTVRVSRPFVPAEQARAGAVLGDVDGLAGVATIALGSTGADTVDVVLRGTGGSALIFSEIYASEPLLGDGGVYYYGGYLEVYNNADTTVQLAGKIWFDAWPGYIEGTNYGCTTFAATQNDPAGLWADYVYRFPPTARPLQPGETTVIATDAIDHRQIKTAPGFFDLSHAEFEFAGTKDADNPLAQNLLDVGPYPFVADGHGWRSRGGRTVIGLAAALDLTLLPTHTYAFLPSNATLIRIPREALLDVVQWKPMDATYTSPYVDCASSVQPEMDAAEARSIINFTDTLSMHRRVSRTLPTGRLVLQRSRNSAADWYAAPGTPGTMP
ncbi:MAG: DUF4876 domain-containing protein [bacterium]